MHTTGRPETSIIPHSQGPCCSRRNERRSSSVRSHFDSRLLHGSRILPLRHYHSVVRKPPVRLLPCSLVLCDLCAVADPFSRGSEPATAAVNNPSKGQEDESSIDYSLDEPDLIHSPGLLLGRGAYGIRFGQSIPVSQQDSATGGTHVLEGVCDNCIARVHSPEGLLGGVTETSLEAEVCGGKVPPASSHNQPPPSVCPTKSIRESSRLDRLAFHTTLLCSTCEFVTLQNLWASPTLL